MKYKLITPSPVTAPVAREEQVKNYIVKQLARLDDADDELVLIELKGAILYMGMSNTHVAILSSPDKLKIVRSIGNKTVTVFDVCKQ